MPIEDIFRSIEKDIYKNRINLASDFMTAIHAAQSGEFLGRLIKITIDKPSTQSKLAKQILSLISDHAEENYENPYDPAILIYLMALNRTNPELARSLSSILKDKTNLWWSRKYARRLQNIQTNTIRSGTVSLNPDVRMNIRVESRQSDNRLISVTSPHDEIKNVLVNTILINADERTVDHPTEKMTYHNDLDFSSLNVRTTVDAA